MNLPQMAGGGSAPSGGQSDADVKAAVRAKARGKNALIDAFFEYLSDSFRPLLPVLLGASLILAALAVLEAFKVVNTHAEVIPSWLGFTNSMWPAGGHHHHPGAAHPEFHGADEHHFLPHHDVHRDLRH